MLLTLIVMEVLFAEALASERIPAYMYPACIPDVVLQPSHIDGIRREKQIPRSAVKLWEIVSEVAAEVFDSERGICCSSP